MSMGAPMTLFDLAQRGMSSQMVRMNAAASNLANAGSVAGSQDKAYRPLRPVFAEELDTATGLSSVRVDAVRRSDAAPVKHYDPDHPLADAEGNVWLSAVDENEEMVEMLEASRQYQNLLEALTTAKQLMLETMRMK
ncbi:MAG: flagellar basal body rod protein FlgC [Sphingomonadaceae bacterium]|nr:flagellar basal body rod protein FlgC [Sphingomonadaceae bacterium]